MTKILKPLVSRKLLYYPSIDIPNEQWIRNAILYWDEIGSIVPHQTDDLLSPQLRYLQSIRFYSPTRPDVLIVENNDKFREMKVEFFEIVDSIKFQAFLRRIHRVSYRIHIDKISASKKASIHQDKGITDIFNGLNERGLISPEIDDRGFFLMERVVFMLYISILAKYLADLDTVPAVIGTDKSTYEKFNFKRVSNDSGAFEAVNLLLYKFLPTPKGNMSFEQLINFKERFYDHLLEFRKILDEFQDKVSNSEHYAEAISKSMTMSEKLTKGVNDLTLLLKDKKISFKLSSLSSLMKINSPAAWLTGAAIYAKDKGLTTIPTSVQVGGIALAAAIQLGVNYVENRNFERAILRQNPFSYIYYGLDLGILK